MRQTIAAACVAVVPLVVSIFMISDYRLGDTQNAVDGTDLAGVKVEAGQEEDEAAGRSEKEGTPRA